MGPRDLRHGAEQAGQAGAVYPTEAINLAAGFDVRTWLSEGLLDYVVPTIYGASTLEMNYPVKWLVDLAHENDAAMYPLLQPYSTWDNGVLRTRQYATPAMMRAAIAGYRDRGADGMYVWALPWPFRDTERAILSDMSDEESIKERDKHYIMASRSKYEEDLGYCPTLPLKIDSGDLGKQHPIEFHVADDVKANAARLRRVVLRLNIASLVTGDRLVLRLNGESLEGEVWRRWHSHNLAPYSGQWLEIELTRVMPRRGTNVLDVSLEARPKDLFGAITVEDVEMIVEYGPYPTSFGTQTPG